MTDFVHTAQGDSHRYQSTVQPKGTTIMLGPGLLTSQPHCFLGVEMFSDAEGEVPATATGGTFSVAVTTADNPQGADSALVSSIEATDLVTVSWQANTTKVTVTPSGIAGAAAYWRVNLSMNRT